MSRKTLTATVPPGTPKPAPSNPSLPALKVNTGLAVTDPKAALAAKTPAPKGPQKSYDVIMREQDSCVKSVLDDMTYLVAALQSKNPRDDDLAEIRDRFMAVKNEVPTQIVVAVGGCLWEYRNQIKSADANAENFLLAQDFKASFAAARKDLPQSDNFEKFPEILHKIKLTWHFFSAVEKNEVWTRAKRMLSMYATYEGNRRALATMK